MEKTKYQRYLEYVDEWLKRHPIKQRISDFDKDNRERPLTIQEWLLSNID
ncbi:MAG: hypothetical protein AB6733_00160 [Clostridiaceae bacterium]